jgi:hypothetical protein
VKKEKEEILSQPMEKTTLGDISELAELKSKMESGSKE